MAIHLGAKAAQLNGPTGVLIGGRNFCSLEEAGEGPPSIGKKEGTAKEKISVTRLILSQRKHTHTSKPTCGSQNYSSSEIIIVIVISIVTD